MISDNLLSDAFDSIIEECGLTRSQARLLRDTSSLSSVPSSSSPATSILSSVPSIYDRITVTHKDGLVKLKHVREPGKLNLQWAKGGVTPSAHCESVKAPRRPLIYADTRQELCESLPYFRAYNSGVYHHDGVSLSYF